MQSGHVTSLLGAARRERGKGRRWGGTSFRASWGSSLLPLWMRALCPPWSVALASTGCGAQRGGARPRFNCSEQRRSDSRPMSPGAAVPGCRRAWCPHERVHPSPASWPPPRGPAERAGGCVLTWGFLCWGLGPFLKTPPPSWCCPVRTLTCLQKRHRWGWAHGLCGESRREGPGELEAEREDSSQEGCKQRCCCCSPLPGPLHPPPKKRKPPGGEEGRQIPPSCSARTHVETQGRTPAACRLPELSGLVP